jgi:hypothetical protein
MADMDTCKAWAATASSVPLERSVHPPIDPALSWSSQSHSYEVRASIRAGRFEHAIFRNKLGTGGIWDRVDKFHQIHYTTRKDVLSKAYRAIGF